MASIMLVCFPYTLKLAVLTATKFLDDSLYCLCALSLCMGLKRAKNGVFGYVAISTVLALHFYLFFVTIAIHKL